MAELAYILLVIAIMLLIDYKGRTKEFKPKVSYVFSESYKLEQFRLLKKQYLSTQSWKTKKAKALELANNQCTHCGSKNNLNVHHDYGYKLIPNEPISCLRVLCSTCHTRLHEKYGYPQTLDEYYNFDTRGLRLWLKNM